MSVSSKRRKTKKQRSEFQIFSSTGAVVHRAYVEDPSQGLRGADLSTADLTGAVLLDAIFDDTTKFPKGFDAEKAGMVHVEDLPAGDPGRI